jgi:hypothetical protein
VRTELRARQGKVSGSICFWNCVSRGVNSFSECVDDAASGTVHLIYKRKQAPILQQGTKTTERSRGWSQPIFDLWQFRSNTTFLAHLVVSSTI